MKIQINHDKELADMARKALKANDYYCPCALFKDESTRCICADFRQKMRNGYIGECNCGLYETVEQEFYEYLSCRKYFLLW